jgi:hypothetical protein
MCCQKSTTWIRIDLPGTLDPEVMKMLTLHGFLVVIEPFLIRLDRVENTYTSKFYYSWEVGKFSGVDLGINSPRKREMMVASSTRSSISLITVFAPSCPQVQPASR